MKIALACFALLAALTIGVAANADDIPFGADALRHLSTEASVIARASQPSRQRSDNAQPDDPSRAKYAVFAVTAAEVLKGDLPTGSSIRITFPESLSIQNISQLDNAILFLRPFAEGDIAQTNIPRDGAVYLVISGRYGAVDGAPANREEAIREYLGSTSNDAVRSETVLSWTDRYIGSSDPFLQRSAIVDLFHERNQARAVEQLARAVRSEAVLPSLKKVAIDALQGSSATTAAQPLHDVAQDAKVQKNLRERAVKAIATKPGGRDQLIRWSTSTDPVLSGAANSAIRNVQ